MNTSNFSFTEELPRPAARIIGEKLGVSSASFRETKTATMTDGIIVSVAGGGVSSIFVKRDDGLMIWKKRQTIEPQETVHVLQPSSHLAIISSDKTVVEIEPHEPHYVREIMQFVAQVISCSVNLSPDPSASLQRPGIDTKDLNPHPMI